MSCAGIRVAYKSVMILADMFRKPKDKPTKVKTKGIVYKVKCKYCSFTYIGESKRSWNSRWSEDKPGVRRKHELVVRDHVERRGHDISSNDVEVLEKAVTNYCGCIFLESLHAVLNRQSVNEHKEFPRVYAPLLKSLEVCCPR